MLGDRLLTTQDVEALADVPPRDELLARLAGGFQAPLAKAAGLFQAFTRNFAYGLKAYVDQRVEGGEALPQTPKHPQRRQATRRRSHGKRPRRQPPLRPANPTMSRLPKRRINRAGDRARS